MQDTGAQAPVEALDEDDTRLAHLGYRPQLNRVLGLFANFSVAFTYLSPMVGIFSFSCSAWAPAGRPTSG